jgi:TrpR-related protein YerC/YecD
MLSRYHAFVFSFGVPLLPPTPVYDLLDAFVQLRTREEAEAFLVDLCTPAELEALSGRWRVARLVREGIPYREIHDRTGVSTATITRVARALTQGTGGYRRMLDLPAKPKRSK